MKHQRAKDTVASYIHTVAALGFSVHQTQGSISFILVPGRVNFMFMCLVIGSTQKLNESISATETANILPGRSLGPRQRKRGLGIAGFDPESWVRFWGRERGSGRCIGTQLGDRRRVAKGRRRRWGTRDGSFVLAGRPGHPSRRPRSDNATAETPKGGGERTARPRPTLARPFPTSPKGPEGAFAPQICKYREARRPMSGERRPARAEAAEADWLPAPQSARATPPLLPSGAAPPATQLERLHSVGRAESARSPALCTGPRLRARARPRPGPWRWVPRTSGGRCCGASPGPCPEAPVPRRGAEELLKAGSRASSGGG